MILDFTGLFILVFASMSAGSILFSGNRGLAALIAAGTTFCILHGIFTERDFALYLVFIRPVYALLMAQGPAFILLLDRIRGKKVPVLWYLLFLPALFMLAIQISSILGETGIVKNAFVLHQIPSSAIMFIHVLTYIPFIVRTSTSTRTFLAEQESSPRRISVDWAWQAAAVSIFLLVLPAVIFILSIRPDAAMPFWMLRISPALAAPCVLYLSILLGRENRTGGPKEKMETARKQGDDPSPVDPELVAALGKLMDEKKPWMNPELTLVDLARMLGFPRNRVSEAINKGTGSSFYTYINTFRVTEAKRRLSDPACDRYTLLAIGLDSGFGSKAAFARVFHELCGMSPGEFKRQSRQSLSRAS